MRQDIEGQLYAMEAEARAQRGRETALAQQRSDLRARLRRLQELEPEFRQLLRERSVLETNASNFATRAEDARARSEMLTMSTDNISSVERANVPAQGKSLRLPIAIITVLLAGLASVAAGLARGYMRRGFPTPASAERTLGAPVLAVLPRARAKREKKRKREKPPRPEKGPPTLTLVEPA